MSYDLGFPEVVAPYRAAERDEGALYRAIMAHEGWRVRVRAEDGRREFGVVVTPNGGTILEVFSSHEAIELFEAREGAEPAEWERMRGYVLFGSVDASRIDRLNLDLHSEHALHFYGDQYPVLHAWSRTVAAELALMDPEQMPNPFAVLARYPEFRVVTRATSTGRDLVLAPDPERRALGAVFTAEDTVSDFLLEARERMPGADLRVGLRDGAQLADELLELHLDGVVFNPLTRLPPVALHIGAMRELRRFAGQS